MKLITTHSFKGGTGKTNVIANLSYALVNDGFKVGVVDSDASHPSLHIMYGLGDRQPHPTLTEFLLGKCESFDIVHDLSEEYNLKEKLYLIPANLDGEVIRKLINEGFEIGHLFRGLKEVGEQAKLDFMLIDTRPGLDEKTMLFLIMTDVLLILVRNDEADIRGTKTLLNIVDFFRIPIKYLTPNMIDVTNTEKIMEEFNKLFKDHDVLIANPLLYSEKLCMEHSPHVDKLFISKYPEEAFSKSIFELKDLILKIFGGN